jgi:hypothetical protein
MTDSNVLLALATATALAGCATLLTDPPAGSPQGTSGTVAYNPNGVREIVLMRRDDAIQKIKTFCGGGPYRIDAEATRPASESIDQDGSVATAGADEIRTIKFTCE